MEELQLTEVLMTSTREENTLLLAVTSEHYVTARRHVIIHHTVTVRELLGEVFFSRIWACCSDLDRRTETESDGSEKTFGFIHEPNVDLFVDSDGSVTEYDAF